MNIEKIDSGITELMIQIGVPEEFFSNLLKENDWSFVIKLHALIEAACTQLLIHHLNNPSLADIISRIELSDKTKGKLALLKATNLLNKEYRTYINSLSEIRNKFVHDVRNCVLSLDDLLSQMDEKKFNEFTLNFSPYEKSTNEKYDIDSLKERAEKHPKIHIFIGAYALFEEIANKHGFDEHIYF